MIPQNRPILSRIVEIHCRYNEKQNILISSFIRTLLFRIYLLPCLPNMQVIQFGIKLPKLNQYNLQPLNI